MNPLMVHPVKELFISGLVECHWMYLMKRYVKTFKDYAHTKARLEGSMAKGFANDDMLGFCTKYMVRFTPTNMKVWNFKEGPIHV
jgi:hypothetical protein